MKKFFTLIPLQKRGGLEAKNYKVVGNSALQMEEKTCFPIVQVIHGYAKKNEQILVIAVRNQGIEVIENCSILEDELKKLSESIGFEYEIKYVDIAKSQDVNTQIETFQKIIEHTQEDDEIFGCLTYGTKPQSLALKMALHYANKIKYNTFINCVVYGQIDRDSQKQDAYIYDITAMLQMEEIINKLAESKMENPSDVLKQIIEL